MEFILFYNIFISGLTVLIFILLIFFLWEEGEMGNYCLIGTEFQFGMMRKF
jgi:hypothetical protein